MTELLGTTRRRARRAGFALAGVVALVVVGACTAVPNSGPVRAGQQQAVLAAPNVRLPPQAPVLGDTPDLIVSGFRYANSDTTAALGVAKAYLTDGASWQPLKVVVVADSGASPTDTTVGDTTTVKIVDTQVGQIAADGTYKPSAAGATVDYTYQLTKDSKEKGEWRISNPPPYLVLTVAQIESSYQSGYVYFLRPDERMLVPVRVFLPVSREGLAAALLTTLLHGPPDWLKPAVTTALPAGTAPAPTQDHVNGVSVTTVSLPQRVASLSSAQRNAIAAQISFTLSNPATLSQDFGELKILAGGQPLQSSPQLAVQTAENSKSFDPDGIDADFYYSDLAHQTHDHTGHFVPGETGDGVTDLLAPVVAPRPGGDGNPTLIAGVVQDSTTTQLLYAGPLLAPKELLRGSSFTTPSWDSLGNLWTVQQDKSSSVPKVRVAPTGEATLPGVVAAPELANKVIKELKVSRDGTRVAVLAVSTNVSQVLVGAVTKDGTAIENFYPVAPGLTSVTDFVWASSTTLDILGSSPNSSGPGASSALWTVDVDGWLPAGSLQDLPVRPNAESIAAAPGKPVVIATSAKDVEVYEHNQWTVVGTGSAPHYPG